MSVEDNDTVLLSVHITWRQTVHAVTLGERAALHFGLGVLVLDMPEL